MEVSPIAVLTTMPLGNATGYFQTVGESSKLKFTGRDFFKGKISRNFVAPVKFNAL